MPQTLRHWAKPKFSWKLWAIPFLLIGSLAIAQTAPVPWSGTRDKSCEVYHSAKYKTPIYSAEAINSHLIEVLGVDNTQKLFYRWEQPVRYYLEVPPEYPELIQLFEEQVAQVVKYTGLDIKRHDKPYLKRNDEKLNDRKSWPEGRNTNAVIVWTLDMEKSLRVPLIEKLNSSLGTSPEQALREWQQLKKEDDDNKLVQKGYIGFLHYGMDPDGMKLVFLHKQPVQELKKTLRVSLKNQTKPMLRIAAKDLITISFSSDKLPSIFGYDMSLLTDFDKQFLRVLYGKHVNSGMILIKAKRLMFEELVDCFNAKTSSAKG
jgi:hypothetical protein